MLIFGGSILVILAYLLGSIPFGLVLTRLFTSIDIRNAGSGNIGATNVRRLAGNLLGFLTLAGDILKGALPVLLAMALLRGEPRQLSEAITICVAVGAFAGHLYPVYLGFKTGGKGVATALGGCLVISPPAVLIFLLVFVLSVKFIRRVSVGSLFGAVVLVPAVAMFTGSAVYATGCLVMTGLIFVRHRENLKRILAGTEPTIDQKPEQEPLEN